ncbi:helix-turn-helix domain-containing protein [Marisediminicola sp. LYQ134]|uniref:AraC family transcriptional regulator n=1 Tax=Marisediminicola sp. LYQ134 TaxID=3391061 RepID=UPI0039834BC7
MTALAGPNRSADEVGTVESNDVASEIARARYHRFESTSTDFDEACASYESIFTGRHFRGSPVDGAFAFRYASMGDANMTLRTSTFPGQLRGEIPHLADYVVTWFREGLSHVSHRHGDHASSRSDPFLLPTERPFDFEFSPHRVNLIHVTPSFLEDTATERHGGPSQAIVFDHTVHPTESAVQSWRRDLGGAMSSLASAASSPLLRLSAQLALVRSILTLFPWRAMEIPQAIRTWRTARVRDAVEFIHEHAHEPISPADIARAAHVHTRTLQMAMSTHLGVSPAAYVRQVRLDRVRTELAESAPRDTFVSDVAARWGFGNLGRFSAAYVTRFGEYPRTTLAR